MAKSVRKRAHWKLLLSFFAVLFLTGLALVYAFGDVSASSSLLVLSIIGLIASICITYGVNRLSRRLIVPTMISVSFVFQLAVLTFYLMVGGSPIIRTTFYYPNMADNPLLAVLPLFILPSVTLVVVFIARDLLWKRSERSALFIDHSNPVEIKKLVFYLSIAAILMLLAMPALVYFGVLGYFIRVLWSALSMTPMIAGWLSSKNRKVNVIWIAALGAALVLSIVTGSRGTAFRSLGYFLIGRMIGSLQEGRIREILRIGGVSIVVITLFGFIGSVRNQIGRVGVNELSSERILAVFESSEQHLDDDTPATTERGSNLQKGLYRLIVAANLVVPTLTQRGIPTRGIDGLWNEALSYVDLSLFSGTSKRTRLQQGLGSAAATLYGFRVNRQTSVPFPVIADGWSRAGVWGAIMFSLFVVVVLILLECFVIYATANTPARRTILLCVIGLSAFYGINSDPAFSVIRTLLLYVPFTWVCLVLMDYLRLLVLARRPQASRLNSTR